MGHAISLALTLFGLWLLLSGMFQGLLIFLGLVSCALVVVIALRMDVVDHEGQPLHLRFGRLAGYWVWLGAEIVKSNIDVAKRVLSPSLPISPTVVRVRTTQHTDVGRVTYANSITLTPGTVSIDLDEECITVHSLTREGAEALLGGEMDRRVTALETDD